MPDNSAEIKGSLFPLSVLHLEDNDLEKLQQQLESKVQQAPAFFYRAPIAVNIEKLTDAELDFAELKQIIEAKDFVFVGVCNADDEQKQRAHTAGLATLRQNTQPSANKSTTTRESSPSGKKALSDDNTAGSFTGSKILRQNVRSGQQIYAKNSDLTIIGSVSNGAEVISDGNIHIYGSLRGRAIAGATGNLDSTIFCHSIQAELVSIAGHYWLSESLPEDSWKKPVYIKLEQEQLTIQPLPSINH